MRFADPRKNNKAKSPSVCLQSIQLWFEYLTRNKIFGFIGVSFYEVSSSVKSSRTFWYMLACQSGVSLPSSKSRPRQQAGLISSSHWHDSLSWDRPWWRAAGSSADLKCHSEPQLIPLPLWPRPGVDGVDKGSCVGWGDTAHWNSWDNPMLRHSLPVIGALLEEVRELEGWTTMSNHIFGQNHLSIHIAHPLFIGSIPIKWLVKESNCSDTQYSSIGCICPRHFLQNIHHVWRLHLNPHSG